MAGVLPPPSPSVYNYAKKTKQISKIRITFSLKLPQVYLIGESLLTILALFTYPFQFSDQAIKLHLWILPKHNHVIYLWKFEPKMPIRKNVWAH